VNINVNRQELYELMLPIDPVADIKNTLRFGMQVKLEYDNYPPEL
jgi:hypothetical protein